MSQRDAYLAALVPTPYRVLGRLLRPYSLGHALLLQRIASPYSIDGAIEAEVDDMMLAMIVCSHTFRDGAELLASPAAIDSELKSWGRPLRRWFRTVKLNVAEASLTFQDYLEEGRRYPKLWSRHGASGPCYTSPWQERVRLTLMRFGYSVDEVMDMYLPALWYAFHTANEIEMFNRAKSTKEIVPVFLTEQIDEFITQDREARESSGN